MTTPPNPLLPSAKEKEIPIPDAVADLSTLDEEPWKDSGPEPRYRQMQSKVGDPAIFFRKAAVEITFEEKRYLVVPQAAILVLIRDELPI